MMGDGRCKNRRDIAGQKRIAGKRDPTIFRVRIFSIKLFPFLKPNLLFAGCYCSCRLILPCFFFLLCWNRYAIVIHFYNCHFGLICFAGSSLSSVSSAITRRNSARSDFARFQASNTIQTHTHTFTHI